MAQKKRIEYIDCIKGFSILWVVVYHFGTENIPEWVTIGYRMPLFFFLSGIFFRAKPFKEFLIRRINTLIIPFFFWMIVSAFYYYCKYNIIAPILDINHGTFEASLLDMIKLFNIHNENVHAPLSVNIALWFLISLFCIQIIFWGINSITKKNKSIILFICILLYISGQILLEHDINGLCYIGQTLKYIIYYALGALAGFYLMQYTQTQKNRILIIIFTIPIIILLNYINYSLNSPKILNIITLNSGIICFIPAVFAVSQYIANVRISKILSFFGRNSLVVLVTHLTIMDALKSIIEKGLKLTLTPNIYYCILFLFICLISTFIIILTNRYLPFFIGKKDLIKLKPRTDVVLETIKENS